LEVAERKGRELLARRGAAVELVEDPEIGACREANADRLTEALSHVASRVLAHAFEELFRTPLEVDANGRGGRNIHLGRFESDRAQGRVDAIRSLRQLHEQRSYGRDPTEAAQLFDEQRNCITRSAGRDDRTVGR